MGRTSRREMDRLLKLDRLEIIGLMCIPPAGAGCRIGPGLGSRSSGNCAMILEIEFGVRLPSLSMGMSGDFEVAIEEGATHVRVGSAIFGKRSYRVDGELG